MSAEPSPRNSPNPNAAPRPGSPGRGDGARARLTIAPHVARRRLRARLVMWGAVLVTVASLFTLVAFHVFAAQSAFSLERLSKDRANEQLRYERLREQVAVLSSAQTVIFAARRYGMVPGPSVIDLAAKVPPAVVTGDTQPAEAPDTNYGKTKKSLDAAAP